MSRSVPRIFSLAGAFCVLFFLGVHPIVSLGTPTTAGRSAGNLFDLVPPPDVRYPIQAPITGFDIDGTKPPVSPTEPEPPHPVTGVSVPPSLERRLRHVASDTGHQKPASPTVRAGGTASSVASVSAILAPRTASSAMKILGGIQQTSSATIALTEPKGASENQKASGSSPVRRDLVSDEIKKAPAASKTIVRVPIPVPAPAAASSTTVSEPSAEASPPAEAEVASPTPVIVSPAATATAETIPLPASPAATLPTFSQASAAAHPPPSDIASAPAVAGDQKTDREAEPEIPVESGQPAGTASAEAIIQKAREYHEVGSFKKMLALLDENQDLVGEMPEAAALRLGQYLNDPQPDYRLMRSVAGIILERDGNDVDANYAMGLYWSSLKKPDLGKALKHLALAKNAKKPRPGASGLYWRLFAKSYWYLFLLPLVIVAAVIDKRRKLQAGLSAAEAVPGQGGSGRLSSLAESLKKLAAKLRRRPTPSPGDSPDEQSPDKGSGDDA